MNRQTISLNGIWQMAWCDIGTKTPQDAMQLTKVPYAVPGDVHTPLMEAGFIQEPLQEQNDLACRWVEEKEFWCERHFSLTESDLHAHMLLTFHGLDCSADIYLNGQLLGHTNNAFVPFAWDVRPFVNPGENILLVRIDQGLHEAQQHDLEQMGTMWNNEQPWRAWMRKPQFVYGWDWTIWLATCGIWQDVTLTCFDSTGIADVYARPADNELHEGAPCHVKVTVTQHQEVPCTVQCILLDQEGHRITACAEPMTSQHQTLSLTIPEAKLWWCNGMGDPYLYRLTITLLDAQGQVLDTHHQRLGLKTIALEEPALPGGETGFTFVLNGERVFCKGANHVPCDCLPGRIKQEKERALIDLAKSEHMNMLRVWGGGVYASETLMDACDEAGIMVWHDFLYACGYYPDHDASFVANITDEAQKGIIRLRRHASLIGWAGNNEIQEMYGCQKQWNPTLPWYGGRIYEEILPSLVQDMCPELIYRPSSPFGGEYQADTRHGDQHIWVLTHVDTHPHYMDLWRFTEFPVKFLSEFGIMGAMTMETAQHCISTAHMHPDDEVWVHHTNSCQEHTLLDRMMKQYFGDATYSPQQYILRSQAIQSEITRHLYEEFRRQKFTCSGLLFWTLSDSYGVHNWSLIDYELRRKPIYYALREAMAPYALCIRGWDVQTNEGRNAWRDHWQTSDSLEIWGMNDTRVDASLHLVCTLMTTDGTVLQEETLPVSLPANQSSPLHTFTLPALTDPSHVVLRARLMQGNACVNETKYFFAPFAEMIATNATVHHTVTPLGDGEYALTLTADRFIWNLHISEPDGTTVSDNDFDLWPGESRTVRVKCHAADGYQPTLCWMGMEETYNK